MSLNARHIGLNLFGSLFITFLGFISGVLAARILGPEGRGELGQLVFAAQLVAGLTFISVSDVIVISAGRTMGRCVEVYDLAVRACTAVTGVNAIVVALIAVHFADSFPSIDPTALVMFCAATMTVTGIDSLAQGVSRSTSSHRIWEMTRVLTPALYTLTLAVLYFIPSNLNLILIGHSLALLLPIPVKVYFLFHARSHFGENNHFFNKSLFWKNLLILMPPAILAAISAQSDRLILTLDADHQEFGFYIASWSIPYAATGVALVCTKHFLLPALSATTDENVHAFTRQFNGITSTLMFCITLGQIVLLPYMQPIIFGDQFSPGIPISQMIAFAFYTWPARQNVVEMLKNYKRSAPMINIEIIYVLSAGAAFCALRMIGMNTLFAMAWSLIGANLAATIYAFKFAYGNNFLRELSYSLVPFLFLIRQRPRQK